RPGSVCQGGSVFATEPSPGVRGRLPLLEVVSVNPTHCCKPTSCSSDPLQEAFLRLLPRIELHGQVVFRTVKCPDQQQEAIAEMVALAWRWFVRLHRQGKDPREFPSALAIFAARQVRSGRRLCGQEKARDVLSPVAQQRGQVKVEALPHSTCRS